MESIVIDKINEFNSDLSNEIRDNLSIEMNQCIQCGTCTASCPSGARTALRTRRLIREVIIGDDSLLDSSDLWLCTTCFTCMERCPREVPITDIILYLRNLAVQRGHINPNHLKLLEDLTSTGHGVPLDDEKWFKLRKFYKLNGIPPTVQSDSEQVDEVRYLLKCTTFKDIINVDNYPVTIFKPEKTEEEYLKQW
ncbi:MAG: CoB--CoM heterodisulfide reductase subunit C [Candidatus Lokiarchaeota archaeon]